MVSRRRFISCIAAIPVLGWVVEKLLAKKSAAGEWTEAVPIEGDGEVDLLPPGGELVGIFVDVKVLRGLHRSVVVLKPTHGVLADGRILHYPSSDLWRLVPLVDPKNLWLCDEAGTPEWAIKSARDRLNSLADGRRAAHEQHKLRTRDENDNGFRERLRESEDDE